MTALYAAVGFGRAAPPGFFIRKDAICQQQELTGREDKAVCPAARDSRCLKNKELWKTPRPATGACKREAGSPVVGDSSRRQRSKTARAKRPAKSKSETASTTLPYDWLAATASRPADSPRQEQTVGLAVFGQQRDKALMVMERQTGGHWPVGRR
jgi:hypothetical protein